MFFLVASVDGASRVLRRGPLSTAILAISSVVAVTPERRTIGTSGFSRFVPVKSDSNAFIRYEQEQGYCVLTARDAAGAFDLFTHHEIDVVIGVRRAGTRTLKT